MKNKNVVLLTATLFMVCATCVQVHAEEEPANPNVAPKATVTANSESTNGRKYLAENVIDGKIPAEKVGTSDDCGKQTVWSVDAAKDSHESGWLKFTWETPTSVREIVYFGKTAWTLEDCFKDYEVYLGDDKAPVAKGTFEKRSGPQSIVLDKMYKTSQLTLKFTSSYGKGYPGASEVFIFPKKATTRDLLLAWGGWKITENAFLTAHLPSFGLANPRKGAITALIVKMKKEYGDQFDAAKYQEKLRKLTNDNLADDETPLWGYRLSPLEKLQLQILLFDEDQKYATIPAFPGAEGFGAYTVGGRGGKVIEVTNLNDKGPGSFRAAVEAEGPRTVVFRVSGTIRLETPLRIKNPYITIAGQTAPGDGICIQGHGIDVSADQVIIRFLRVRPGDVLNKPIGDAISGRFVQNVIIDHCSMSWTMDEVCTWYLLGNVTVQWCLMSEALDRSLHHKGAHGAGHATGGFNLSSHHNLIMSNSFRNPRFSGCGARTDSIVDFRNNVVYNFVTSAYGGEGGTYNFVANYYKPGPSSKSRHFLSPYAHKEIGYGRWYITDNVFVGNDAVTKDNWTAVHPAKNKADKPFPTAEITTQTAEKVYELVLENVGAIYPKRDAVDARVVKETKTGGGKIINSQSEVGGYPELKTYNVLDDTDHDGMPDVWEKQQGLDIDDPEDRNGIIDPKTPYTNLERYLNQIADKGPLVEEK